MRTLESLQQLDFLPVGSVIADVSIPNAPAVACRAVLGWQFLGDLDDRRYNSDALWSEDVRIDVLYEPEFDPVEQ